MRYLVRGGSGQSRMSQSGSSMWPRYTPLPLPLPIASGPTLSPRPLSDIHLFVQADQDMFPPTELQSIAATFRAQRINGLALAALSHESLRTDLKIEIFGQRCFLLHARDKLAQSTKKEVDMALTLSQPLLALFLFGHLSRVSVWSFVTCLCFRTAHSCLDKTQTLSRPRIPRTIFRNLEVFIT